ncbi:hypothetical protein [Paracidovorax avenae]|uniref:hypothetical protein n=1 Tax=Paracidovorax avenae TaxID=80867 RepID=UPI001314CD2A|nr:hypothetical protein [Paracidovorax avenae]
MIDSSKVLGFAGPASIGRTRCADHPSKVPREPHAPPASNRCIAKQSSKAGSRPGFIALNAFRETGDYHRLGGKWQCSGFGCLEAARL